ncbi:bifunctional phosphopantothenoylcysteine decarboxylase/phosphopantothenate--cysteine ligase CoaBC [Spiroplasma endosymbiont of Virgichneumon dumeticola]|uniref:bifunctional phosphopantothenoylcysteine decarboxylase/phosphopantothenate--cysteine ligase CoaBC n=1 Tax=Spiroplasma endosymbiont of Virgichneumon dumeticola TaxID=3139323 RepID=UPI0035C8ED46
MKHITLIITGSIAAPKAVQLLHKLQANFLVDVICTKSSLLFLPKIDFPYHSEMFEKTLYEKADIINHTNLALKTDLIVVYPATMSFISKATLAIADSLALAIFLASPVPKIIFPAMNHYMYHNQGFQNNYQSLSLMKDITVINPDAGMLACKITGDGRLKEPTEAFEIINNHFKIPLDLTNKTILINYGRTRTYLDPIRYLTNNSSGKMGNALVVAYLKTNANVIAIVGDLDVKIESHPNLTVINANTNEQMLQAMIKHFHVAHIILCAAALNDYQSATYIANKINKTKNENITLSLVPNIDVLKHLGSIKTTQTLIGFVAQDSNDITLGLTKMKTKKCDGMVINNIKVMGNDETEVNFVFKNQNHKLQGSKIDVARAIVNIIGQGK